MSGDVFRCHVGDRSNGGAGACQRRLIGELRDAEIEQLDARCVGDRLRGQEDVRRLDVAMNDTRLMSRGNGACQLNQDLNGFAGRHGATRDPLRQCLAVVVRHHEEDAAVGGLVDFVNRADVRVIEGGCGLRLGDQPLLGFNLIPGRRGEHLDRDDASQSRVFGFIDLAHAAAAERPEDAVVTEDIAAVHGDAQRILRFR